jgi:galactitol-specific phosphotransferase system IIB component
MLIRTQNMNGIIDAVHVYCSGKKVYGSTSKSESSSILLGNYQSNEEAIQAIDKLENWLSNGTKGVFRMS